MIPDGVKIGKNTAISGVTYEEDYKDGVLEGGEVTVSYTHLDVYKRQVAPSSGEIIIRWSASIVISFTFFKMPLMNW